VANTVEQVVAIVEELGIRWCLIGAHAVGEYTEPRATMDVDLLIDDRRMPGLLTRLTERLGDLDVDDIGPAVRLRAIAIDLVRASSNAVFKEVLTNAVPSGQWKIASLEGLIVLKFMAATSPFRGLTRRRQDMVDLIALYRSVDPSDLDRAYALQLAAKIYQGAQDELRAMLDKIDADEAIEI